MHSITVRWCLSALQRGQRNFEVASIYKYSKFSTSLGEIQNHNVLMVVMTPPDCLKLPEAPQPSPG